VTAPLTPPDCDLRAFPTMPLDLVRLFGSEFHAISSDSAWRAGVTLWLRSWHQMPAASLPDDDVQLARLAELGRDVKAWKKLREQALHGWIKCEDGRLYHPVIADMASAAWEKRKAFKERSSKGNSKRWGSHEDGGNDPKAILKGDEKESSNDPKGEGEGEGYSVDKSTGTEAPPIDLADQRFWRDAKAYVSTSMALKGRDPGSMIGKWIKQHGKPETATAITQAQIERAADPLTYVEGFFRKTAQPALAEAPC